MILARRTGALVLPLALAFCALAGGSPKSGRPFSAAERVALEAIRAEISAADGMRISPKIDATMDQIVRSNDTVWELQTSGRDHQAIFHVTYRSGIDETVFFEVRDGSVVDVQILYPLGMPAPRKPVQPRRAQQARPSNGAALSMLTSRESLLAAAFLLLLAGALILRWQPRIAWTAIVCGVAVGALGWILDRDPPPSETPIARAQLIVEPPQKPAEVPDRLRLGKAFASGMADPDVIIAEMEKAGRLDDPWLRREIESLRAHGDVSRMRLDRADAMLARRATDRDAGDHLTAARSAFIHGDAEALSSFDAFIRSVPEHDGILIEAASAALALKERERAVAYLRRAEALGSRQAQVYYLLAQNDVIESRLEEAEAHFIRGWKLEPMLRADVLATPAFAPLLRRPAIAPLLLLWEESWRVPAVQYPHQCEPIAWLAGDGAFAVGERLEKQYDGGRLVIPDGACLAYSFLDPTPYRKAEAVQLEREERLIQNLPMWQNAAAIAGPAHSLGGPIETLGRALADRGDWYNLLALTDSIPVRANGVSAGALMHRCIAFRRTGRNDEATKLLVEIAGSPALQVTRNRDVLRGFAEMFASCGHHAAAIRLLERAGAIRPGDEIDDRILLFRTEQRLAAAYETRQTDHFQIRFPPTIPPDGVERVARSLEREFVRLSSIFPGFQFERIVVNLVPRDEFRNVIVNGNDNILGIYTGKIFVPFEGPWLSTEAEATLTHELCHAILAQATRDNAPRWFQEGLAQTAEKKRATINAFRYLPDDRQLDESLIEDAFHSIDPAVVQAAYLQAETMIYAMVANRREGPVVSYARELRAGAPLEQALSSAVGSNRVGARQWARTMPEIFPGFI